MATTDNEDQDRPAPPEPDRLDESDSQELPAENADGKEAD
jgi:hypothetical protein